MDRKQEPKKKKKRIDSHQASAIAKYSGMAAQMGIIIVIGALGGKKLDSLLQTEPILTMICSLLSVFVALYLSLKDFIKPKKKEKDND